MKFVETFVTNLFPTILVDSTPWREEWEHRQRSQFVPPIRFFFLALGIAYIANFYFFDVPMNLQPREDWLYLRFSVAISCFATMAFYMSPLSSGKLYKLPAILMCIATCYSQSIAVLWYGKEAWIFFFIFILIGSMILRMSMLNTMIFGIATIATSWTNLTKGGVLVPNLVSGSLLALGASSVIRASAVTDVRTFLLQKENDQAQATILSLNSEFLERFQSFIPRVIARRLSDLVNINRMSVVEASVEALKARQCDVACLFTDIRGFTQASKDLNAFINESVMPEVAASSDRIEEHDGIPRKIGDLIFAYFDSDSVHLNLTRCLSAGLEIARINESMNATSSSVTIRRYILISTGEAMVGNFGNLDSSIEITALGPPVNLLSRIDELTKSPSMAKILKHGDVIIDENSHKELARLKSPLQEDTIDLDELGLSIRDFPENRKLYRIPPTERNYKLILQMNQAVQKSVDKLPDEIHQQ